MRRLLAVVDAVPRLFGREYRQDFAGDLAKGMVIGWLFAIPCVIALVVITHVHAYPLIGRCDTIPRDGVINSADLGRIAQGWGLAGETDTNVDGVTNSIDLAWCGRAFQQWEFADGVPYDNSIELPTTTTEGLSLEEQAAQAGICPECGQPSPTQGVPTP